MINKVENGRNYLKIQSHINNDVFKEVEHNKLRTIYFFYTYEEWSKNGKSSYPDKNDLELLNGYIKDHKNILLSGIENWWIPLLPELERFEFNKCEEDINESVELMKNNSVRTLRFRHGSDKKYDLINFLVFKDTLEELSLDDNSYGRYKSIEMIINEMKKLKKLEVSSMKIDFNLVAESSIEDLYYYGSKTKEWDGLVKLQKLKYLFIKSNITLENLDFLKELKDLETLDLWWCSKIKCFPDLSGLRRLNKIEVQECKRLEDITELKKLKNIKIRVSGKMLPDGGFAMGYE